MSVQKSDGGLWWAVMYNGQVIETCDTKWKALEVASKLEKLI